MLSESLSLLESLSESASRAAGFSETQAAGAEPPLELLGLAKPIPAELDHQWTLTGQARLSRLATSQPAPALLRALRLFGRGGLHACVDAKAAQLLGDRLTEWEAHQCIRLAVHPHVERWLGLGLGLG